MMRLRQASIDRPVSGSNPGRATSRLKPALAETVYCNDRVVIEATIKSGAEKVPSTEDARESPLW